MEVHGNGDVNTVSNVGVLGGEAKFSGWLFHFIPGNWFRRKWVKRWVVLKDESLYMYESQTSNNNKKKNLVLVDLMKYQSCGEPDQKKLKKKPNSFMITLCESNTTDPNTSQKNVKNKLRNELFYAENESEKAKWLEKVDDAIKTAKQIKKTNLSHVTKLRAGPRHVQRRPPSRHHLREVATKSQLLPGIDFNVQVHPEPARRGSVPVNRMQAPQLVLGRTVKEEFADQSKKINSTLSKQNHSTVESDGSKLMDDETQKLLKPSPKNVTSTSLPRPTPDASSSDISRLKNPRKASSLDRLDFTPIKSRNPPDFRGADSSENISPAPAAQKKSYGFKLPGLDPSKTILPRDIKAKSMTLLDQCDDSPTSPDGLSRQKILSLSNPKLPRKNDYE